MVGTVLQQDSSSTILKVTESSSNHAKAYKLFELFVQEANAIIPSEDNNLNRSDRLLRFLC